MRKIVLFLAFVSIRSMSFGAAAPVVDVGATSTGTITAIRVTTTPALAYSTGTYKQGVALSTTATWGQYMPDRVNLEFFNDTSTEVFVGYTPNVSTRAVDNDVDVSSFGRRIPAGAAWSPPGRIKNYWVVASTTTLKRFLTIQEK